MKKVLLVTLYGEFNFGNRLQNYALQSVLNNMDYDVHNLIIEKPASRTTKGTIKLFIKSVLVFLGIKRYANSLAWEKRINKFITFREENITNLKFCPLSDIEKKDWSEFNAVITGSDQVWHNWRSNEKELKFYYLSFIEQNKRISYAPSFGFSHFPDKDIEIHRKGLSEMKALSCREREGCDLIRELTGREAKKVLDPTLLLTKEQWEKIEKKPRFFIKTRYILIFFLGEISNEYKSEIEHIRTENNLEIINICDTNNPAHFAISPNEFIWLIHHAEIICTDSFHCSVYSILFEKKLRVFKRLGRYQDMFGRLNDLLEMFKLMDLVYGYGDNSQYSTVLSDETKERFYSEQNISLDYLQNALHDCFV